MPTDRPNAVELVSAVRAFLLEHAVPNTQGQLAFHARVAANALGIVERELTQGLAMDTAERERLVTLLGQDTDLESLNRELAARIRDGVLDDRKAEVLDHLRQTSIDKLAIAKPNYLRTQG
jgi:hypothetical protein